MLLCNEKPLLNYPLQRNVAPKKNTLQKRPFLKIISGESELEKCPFSYDYTVYLQSVQFFSDGHNIILLLKVIKDMAKKKAR